MAVGVRGLEKEEAPQEGAGVPPGSGIEVHALPGQGLLGHVHRNPKQWRKREWELPCLPG